MTAARAGHGGIAGCRGSSCRARAWVFNRNASPCIAVEYADGLLRLALVDHVRDGDGLFLLSRDAAAAGAQRPALHALLHVPAPAAQNWVPSSTQRA